MRKFIRFMRSLLFLLLLAAGTGVLAYLASDEVSGPATVIDGDSIRIGVHEIRLFGIDAPEARQECRSKLDASVVACGRNARAYLRNRLRGQEVVCSGHEWDKYDRMLAVCKLDGEDINAMMVLAGHAVSYGDYEREERQARDNANGLWSGEFEAPEEWRRKAREEHSSGWLSRLLAW